ncbi:MAG: UDP-3-O-(3-hydroxymyristoyl)glucosamine N-acyltransferase [Candidatus Electrothrix aestuarii]|uniref:UDP-3-O-acylglucosamine N-acyltransferase n=1 Tax=Candidatus Electrothrix aestuarii TaxID=3062594 RepID=A0AAU8LST4_9BACT|nr:UDP-3-O-(3-hydroxymyristoyl)glucosamine N-acyltransferase [Candidatus Electrothrix aestuarii]
MKTATLSELAALVHGRVLGDEQTQVSTVNSLDLAEPGQLTFINSVKLAEKLAASKASACIVPSDFTEATLPLIQVENVDLASARIHNYLLVEPFQATGIHERAVIGADCKISDQISIGALACIGDRVQIGERVKIAPGVVIGDDVQIGDDCVLHANAVVAYGCTLANRVVLHHGAIIGSDGFGFASDPQTGCHVSKPQVGTVRIDDDAQIGANSCVDRAAFGVTHIKNGVRIDNQVMVGHNCVIGENSILVAQAGIAGSSTLGRNVILAARAAVGGHIHLDDGVMVAALGGVHNDQKKGAVVGGVPAIDIKKWGRAAAAYARLPEMAREVKRLRKELDRLLSERKE